MNKKITFSILTLTIGFLSLFCGCTDQKEREKVIMGLAEKAYFEGQKAALEGDVRIKWDSEFKCWRWSKSPWNDGTPPVTDISGIKR